MSEKPPVKLGYISVNLTRTEEHELSKQLAALELKPVSSYPFHVTLMFDDRECDAPRCIINPDVIYEATCIGFKVLGKAIVAELHSIGLQREFTRLKEAGYEHSYDTLLLHMSLTYDPSDYDLLTVQSGMKHMLGKTYQFTNQTVRNCE